jgi:hypothetical protein
VKGDLSQIPRKNLIENLHENRKSPLLFQKKFEPINQGKKPIEKVG